MRLNLPLAALLSLAFAAPAAANHHENDVGTAEQNAAQAAQSGTHQALTAAVSHEIRAEDAARDQWRHPVETLEFMRVEPGMTVLDYFASGGWYTRVLAPYLGSDGHYIGTITTLPGASAERQEQQRAFPETFKASVDEMFAEAGVETAAVTALNLEEKPEGMDGTVDRVLIFRFMHNLHRWGMVHHQLTMLRDLLKEDGLLGIVQHRAQADAPYSYANGNNGYLRQDDVIKLVEAHGFELVATSEVNANPADTADHEGGVWQLPPVWSSKDSAKQAIGESDRMTLLFKKRS